MAEEETQTQAAETPTLTVNDLTLTANIIDLAVQRGAFKGAEVETVGGAFNKLVAILRAIAPEQVTNDGDEAQAAPAEEATKEG